MQVCTSPSLTEPDEGLHISGEKDTEWKAQESKTFVSGWIGGIMTVDTVVL